MSKIQIDKIAPNKSNHVTLEGDLVVTGKINGNLPNVSFLPTVPMVYATAWQRAASTFEFSFALPRWWRIGNPKTGIKPYSQYAINPKTGVAYEEEFINYSKEIVAGCRVAWMDEDSSKFYDWNYTYVNPFTSQDQTWEPKGMILPNTNGILPWNSATAYAVNNKVTYNGFIWRCNVANTNQVPTPTLAFTPTDFWRNTGIPANTGANFTVPTATAYSNIEFDITQSPGGQANFYLDGSVNGGIAYWGWGLSAGLAPIVQPKMPIITLNTFLTPTNSNRYPTPFNVQHQIDLIDHINAGLGFNPPVLDKVDMINLGTNINLSETCRSTIQASPYSNGWIYGSAMTEYVRRIRLNSEPITANAKIMIQGNIKFPISTQGPLLTRWIYNLLNPSDTTSGFIHGFYNSATNPTGVNFDIISLTDSGQGTLANLTSYANAKNNVTNISWSWCIGASQYINMRNTIADCKVALTPYNRQNLIKYWFRNNLSTQFGNTTQYGISEANLCWATQTGVFMAIVLAMTDPDFVGYQQNSLFDQPSSCGLGIFYDNFDQFGFNTTIAFQYTAVGWMFKNIFKYFKPESLAVSYTRILKAGGIGFSSSQYGIDLSDYCMGVYINSTSNPNPNETPKHTIILCNYSPQSNQSIVIDASQLIDPSWLTPQSSGPGVLAITYFKYYTTQGIYDPINYYSGGVYYTPQSTTPINTNNPADLSSISLLPTEYLIITVFG